MSLNEEQTKEVSDFLNALDDDEDVHRVYAGI
jgi:transcriptional/translational regulatory protein YebC/TACO1